MRVGYNPHKDKPQEDSRYKHQIIMPVYIPNEEGYFKDSFKIFKLCLESLFATIHDKTFVTVVNNGSIVGVEDYLDELYKKCKIQELIHTENIGKLNAILKGLAGNNIELVTISDSDVMFLPNWQSETVKVFNHFPKVGVVGVVPQFKMYESNCGNTIFDNLFTKNLKFIPVKNKKALIRFYDSIGWDRSYNQNYLKYSLGIEDKDLKVYVGSGHFVATYKKEMFNKIITCFAYKMGGNSEGYLDTAPLKYDYWRVTTYDNYAYHLGNTLEPWMNEEKNKNKSSLEIVGNLRERKQTNQLLYILKNKIFDKFLKLNYVSKLFLYCKSLPKEMINDF